jgi:hypothetical protein
MRQTMFLLVLLPLVVALTAAAAAVPSTRRKEQQHPILSPEGVDRPVSDFVHGDQVDFYKPKDAAQGFDDDSSKQTESVLESRVRRSLGQSRFQWPMTKRRGWGKRNWEELVGDSSDVDPDASLDLFNQDLVEKRRGWGKRTVSSDYNL